MARRNQSMAPYGPIRFLQDRTDEYVTTNLMRYAWIFKLYIHFCPLDATRPAEYLGAISGILETMKIQANKNSGTHRILECATEFFKKFLVARPLKPEDVMENQEYTDFLTSLHREPIPRVVDDEPLRQATIVPDGFENSMKYAVSTVIEGCIFATAKIEIFCSLHKAVCKKFLRNGRHRICKFKGFEMVYVILDRGYLK